jgi:hypothetical protein
VQLNLPRRHCS